MPMYGLVDVDVTTANRLLTGHILIRGQETLDLRNRTHVRQREQR